MLPLLQLALAGDVMTFALVDRFADGRPDPDGTVDRGDPQAWHGGDVQGLIDHLDAIDGDLWISPVNACRTEKIGEWGAFHGYWTTDLHELEPRLATRDELHALSDALRARGDGLWLDLVTNHVGYDAPLIAAHPDWFHGLGDVEDWDDPVQAVTHDVHGLPDLDQDHPEVYAWLRDGAARWVQEVHPVGLRIDAVRHLPTGFLARLGQDLKAIDPDLQLLGEIFDGNPATLAARQRADGLDRVFDFPLHYALVDGVCRGDPGRIGAILAQDAAYDDPSSLVTFLDNHDVPRIRSACGDDLDAVARALTLLFTLRGTPMLTWGTDAALAGAHEPENRADMVFDPRPLRPLIDQLRALRADVPAFGREAPVHVLDAGPHGVALARPSEGSVGVIQLARVATPGLDLPGCTSWTPSAAGLAPFPGRPLGADQLVVSACPTAPPALTEALRPGLARPVRMKVPKGHVLVGAGELLGHWDPARGLTGRVRLDVPKGTLLEYKLVRMGPEGPEWPEGPNAILLAR